LVVAELVEQPGEFIDRGSGRDSLSRPHCDGADSICYCGWLDRRVSTSQ
jgi:hypothetical protein